MDRSEAELIAIAEALGIDTGDYRQAIEATKPENIARTAAALIARVDLSGLYRELETLSL